MKTILIKSSLYLLYGVQIAICTAQGSDQAKPTLNTFVQEWIIKESFDRISVSNGITLHLLTDNEQKIEVQADENGLQCITMEVSSGHLFINAPCHNDNSLEILVQVKLPAIKAITD